MTDEIARLQGTWRIVSLEVEGSKVDHAYFADSKMAISGEAFTTVSMGAAYGGMVVIDPTCDPHKLDMIFTYGPHAGTRSLGIYKFDGDTWILCLSMAASERPEDFVTKPASGHALERLEREPEPKPEPKPDAQPVQEAAPEPAPAAPTKTQATKTSGTRTQAIPIQAVPKPAPKPTPKKQ